MACEVFEVRARRWMRLRLGCSWETAYKVYVARPVLFMEVRPLRSTRLAHEVYKACEVYEFKPLKSTS